MTPPRQEHKTRALFGKVLQYRDTKASKWISAVYHDDIRPRLIHEASLLGQYDDTPAQGYGAHDITAFHPDHEHWGSGERDDWHKITGNVLYRFSPGVGPFPNYIVDTWFDNGRIVLDGRGHPMKKYRDIPLTCSSEIEGWRIEAIRRQDPRISMTDLQARMPRFIEGPKTGNGRYKNKKHAIWALSTIGMRVTRFRWENSIPAWDTNGSSNAYNDAIWARMSEKQRKNNTTEGIVPLNSEERAELKGKHNGRSRKRKSDPEHSSDWEDISDSSEPKEETTPAPSLKRRKVEGKTSGSLLRTSLEASLSQFGAVSATAPATDYPLPIGNSVPNNGEPSLDEAYWLQGHPQDSFGHQAQAPQDNFDYLAQDFQGDLAYQAQGFQGDGAFQAQDFQGGGAFQAQDFQGDGAVQVQDFQGEFDYQVQGLQGVEYTDSFTQTESIPPDPNNLLPFHEELGNEYGALNVTQELHGQPFTLLYPEYQEESVPMPPARGEAPQYDEVAAAPSFEASLTGNFETDFADDVDMAMLDELYGGNANEYASKNAD